MLGIYTLSGVEIIKMIEFGIFLSHNEMHLSPSARILHTVFHKVAEHTVEQAVITAYRNTLRQFGIQYHVILFHRLLELLRHIRNNVVDTEAFARKKAGGIFHLADERHITDKVGEAFALHQRMAQEVRLSLFAK